MRILNLPTAFLFLNAVLLVATVNIETDSILKLRLPSSFSGINPRSAYFGYSLSFAKEDKQIWLYVGSPRANTTSQTGVSNPGAVFKCLVYDFYSSQPKEPCVYVPIDETNNNPNNYTEIIRNDQWLGANIFASPRTNYNLLACGYKGRIKINLEKVRYYAKGLCYELGDDSNVDRIYLTGNNAAYLPMTNVSNFKEGYAQFGTSIGKSKESDNIAIGVPGLWQWRGGIVVKFLFDICTIENLDLPEDSYLGYSVAWINLPNVNNDGYQTLVAGAPRAHIHGMVFVISIYQNCTSLILHQLNGTQFGSYFGASLLTVNSNSDFTGDLLLVGAPLFNQSNGDEGAVLIYRSMLNGMQFVGKLRGSERRGARFGSSIQSLGDTNLDSFEDVVVSAPFEDMGVIYVYLGSSDGLRLQYSQIIMASQIFGNQMHRIGYSMETFVNSNGYPVLALGNHWNDTVVILAARPVHSLKINILFDDNKIEWNQGQCGAKGVQIIYKNLTVSFDYIIPKEEQKYGAPDKYLSNISYTLDMDILMKGQRRGYIESRGDRAWVEKVSETISFDEKNVATPLKRKWTILFPITRQPSNISTPVVFNVSASQINVPSKGQKTVKSINDFIYVPPVFNSLNANFSNSIYFHKECGVDDICRPDFKLSMNHSSTTEAIINSQSKINIPCHIINEGESAYSVQIQIIHTAIIAFESVKFSHDSCNRLLCVPENSADLGDPKDLALINCDLENAIRTEEALNFSLFFVWNKRYVWTSSPDSIEVKVRVKSNEAMAEESMRIESKFGGEILEISKTLEQMPLPDQGGNLTINQRMEVRNIGPGIIPNLKVHIFHLAFSRESNTTSISVAHKQRAVMKVFEHDIQLREINSDDGHLPFVDTYLSTLPDDDENKHLILNCSNVRCIHLEGEITGFEVGDSAEVAIYLNVEENIATKLQKYDSVTFVNEALMEPAKLWATYSDWLSGCCSSKTLTDCCAVNITLQARTTAVKEEEAKPSIPIYIVILGILMGILAMCLLVIILWKCGFFRRSKHEQLIAQKKRSRIISTADNQSNSGDILDEANPRKSTVSVKSEDKADTKMENKSPNLEEVNAKQPEISTSNNEYSVDDNTEKNLPTANEDSDKMETKL